MPQQENGLKKAALFSIHSDPLSCVGSQQAGGQNIYVRCLAEELDKLGWQIDVFTRWDDARKKQIAKIAKKSRVIRLKGGNFGYISKERLMEVLPEIYENFLSFLKTETADNPYQLFHGHYWDGAWLAQKAKVDFKHPLLVNFHSLGMIRKDTRAKFLKEKNELDYFSKRLNIENNVIKNADLIISLADNEKNQLVRLYGCPAEKCLVVPGGVDLQKWQKIPKEKAREGIKIEQKYFYILFVGRLEWRKGVGTLIEAVNLLREEIPNIRALIIGGKIFGREKNADDLKEYNRLCKKARQTKTEDIVYFLGRVANSRLPVFYSACDCLVMPSYYEPFGLVALEGMASGLPVIASRVGGLTSIIDENKNGLLFEPRNAKDLKEKILAVFRSNALTEKLTSNAKEKVKNYSWSKMAKIFAEIYQKQINEAAT